jgi:hypothetical protein
LSQDGFGVAVILWSLLGKHSLFHIIGWTVNLRHIDAENRPHTIYNNTTPRNSIKVVICEDKQENIVLHQLQCMKDYKGKKEEKVNAKMTFK